jgi:surface antigen
MQTSKGFELTGRLLGAVAHIVEGQDADIVIEAMAGAMMAALAASGVDEQDQKLILRRYAERIIIFAELV